MFSGPVTRIAYLLYNSSSMSPATSDVVEPPVSVVASYLSFSGYNGTRYRVLTSPDSMTLYGRKQAFVFNVLERPTKSDRNAILFLIQTEIRTGEYCIDVDDFFCQRGTDLHVGPENQNQGRTGFSNRPWITRQTCPLSSGVTRNSVACTNDFL